MTIAIKIEWIRYELTNGVSLLNIRTQNTCRIRYFILCLHIMTPIHTCDNMILYQNIKFVLKHALMRINGFKINTLFTIFSISSEY